MEADLSSQTAPGLEEVIDPAVPIIDPHHHLWHRPNNPYLFSDLLKDLTSGHNIVSTVFIECSAMYRRGAPEPMRPVGEVEFVAGAAAMGDSGLYGDTKICAGIVSHVNLLHPEWVEPVVAAQVAASGMRLRGVRHQACWHTDTGPDAAPIRAPEGMLADATFRAGFSMLSRLGLSFEAWLYHPQIVELTDLARSFPDTTIVLNHVGGPLGRSTYAGRRQEIFGPWQAATRELAKCENVVVKLGGLGMPICGFGFEERKILPGSEELSQAWKPYFETCIEAFGPDRCMFESNFPVDRASCSYRVLWNAFKRFAAVYSNDERRALFSGTAQRVYRLSPASV